ncbi:MAG: hypothetical protein ACK5HS_01215 [Mycoplasmatales bacterium]
MYLIEQNTRGRIFINEFLLIKMSKKRVCQNNNFKFINAKLLDTGLEVIIKPISDYKLEDINLLKETLKNEYASINVDFKQVNIKLI